MLKKAIAGVLSAVMCVSTLLYDAPFSSRNTAQEGEQMPAASTGAQEDFGLTGSNSLSRYLAKQGTEQAANAQPAAQPLKASAADAVFAVTNLDFDRETGIIQVTSTQSEAATLRASFIDEDSPANVYTVDCGVPAGEYVHSTFSTDAAQLPAYFTVSVQLVGRAGLPLCKAFELKTYNREMQDILEKETSDFAPEQVVNFDEDETTNFIVLSEDTVRAETTEESNVLVSADYDRNIYVFDHIDDSIRSLEKGQYFYIQPTEDDIISTDIREIVIDGDTATITGTGEIDDMFDFIKIEVDTAQTIETNGGADSDDAADEDAVSEEAISKRSYLGVNAQAIDSEDSYNQRLDDLKKLDPDLEMTQYKIKKTIKKEFKKGKFSITPSITLDTTVKWNLYKSFGYINLFFVCDTTAKVTVTGKASVSTPTPQKNNSSTDSTGSENSDTESGSSDDSGDEPEELPDSVAQDPASGSNENQQKDSTPKHLLKIPLATVGAADIYAFVDLGLTLSVEGTLSLEKKFTKGFVYDNDNGYEPINFDTSPVILSADVKASLTFDFKVGFEVSVLKGLVTGSVAGGLKVTASAKLGGVSSQGDNDNQTYNKNGKDVFKADPETDAECIHSDETCIKVDITFKVYIEAKVKVGFAFENPKGIFKKALNNLSFEKTFTYETDEVFGHKMPHYVLFCSHNTSGVYKGWKFDFIKVEEGQSVVCPHQAYRLTFLINFQNAPAGATASLQIDGVTYPLDPQNPLNKIMLHANPRTTAYSYSISVDNQKKISDSVRIKDTYQTVAQTIKWPSVENGTGKPTVGDSSKESGPAFTTAPRTTTTVEEPTSYDYSHLMPSPEMIMRDNKEYDLGEHISGMFSNEGTFSVFGYGDMYPNASIPSSVRSKICRIVFYDQDPENGLYINNIAKSLFEYSTNLEVVYMPERLKEIGDSAFSGCKNLKWLRYSGGGDTSTTFELPDTLTTIGNSAFLNCSSAELGDLVIPKSVTHIGKSAFEGCLKLYSVTIPDENITEVMQHVFQRCAGLKEAYFGPGVTCPDTEYCHWFHYCDALEKLTIPTLILGPKCNILGDLFSNGASGVAPTLTDVTVLSGTVIPASYFSGVSQLKHVAYPDEVTEIGSSAFSGCTNLVSLEPLANSGDPTVGGTVDPEYGDLIISENVTLIQKNAFSNCLKIRTVTVPGTNGTAIMEHVFQDCTGLQEAYFGPGVTCPDTGYCHWFHGCTSVAKLVLPAFSFGPKMNTLSDLFSGSASAVPKTLTNVTVIDGTVIPKDYFKGIGTIASVTFSSALESVETNAFNGCTALAEAYLIGEDADWDNVDINATGNQPLLALVRKGCFSVILSDPKDEVVEEERIAVFTVYAASKGNLSYLWQYSQDGGSNWWSMDCYSNKLTFTASMEQNGTLYHCIVIDQNGFRQTSADAKLTVTEKTILPAAKQPEETPSEQTEQTPRDPKTLPGYKPGDANGDGSIDVSDAVLIARFAVGDTSVTIKDIGVINGDVNGDGNTDIQDVTFILMYIVRKIREFPVAEG